MWLNNFGHLIHKFLTIRCRCCERKREREKECEALKHGFTCSDFPRLNIVWCPELCVLWFRQFVEKKVTSLPCRVRDHWHAQQRRRRTKNMDWHYHISSFPSAFQKKEHSHLQIFQSRWHGNWHQWAFGSLGHTVRVAQHGHKVTRQGILQWAPTWRHFSRTCHATDCITRSVVFTQKKCLTICCITNVMRLVSHGWFVREEKGARVPVSHVGEFVRIHVMQGRDHLEHLSAQTDTHTYKQRYTHTEAHTHKGVNSHTGKKLRHLLSHTCGRWHIWNHTHTQT